MGQKKKHQDRVKTVRIIDENRTELDLEDINFDDVEFKADGKGTITILKERE